jgi:hypothetical protein
MLIFNVFCGKMTANTFFTSSNSTGGFLESTQQSRGYYHDRTRILHNAGAKQRKNLFGQRR